MTARRPRHTLAIASVLALCGTSTAAAQAPVFFDGFLADNAGLPADNFDAFFLWDVSGGSVDLVGPPLPNVFDRYVDLGGSTGDGGRFETRAALPLVVGTAYQLSFDYNSVDGNPNAAFAILGTRSFRVETSSTAFAQFSSTFTFDGLSLAPLVFQDEGGDTAGIGIDNVTVSVANIIPEPTTATSSLGLATSMLLLRRQWKKVRSVRS